MHIHLPKVVLKDHLEGWRKDERYLITCQNLACIHKLILLWLHLHCIIILDQLIGWHNIFTMLEKHLDYILNDELININENVYNVNLEERYTNTKEIHTIMVNLLYMKSYTPDLFLFFVIMKFRILHFFSYFV